MEIADVWLDLFGQTWDLSVRDVAACRQHTSVQVQGACFGHFGRPHQRVLGRALWEVSTSHAVVHFPVLQAKNECKGMAAAVGGAAAAVVLQVNDAEALAAAAGGAVAAVARD
eukprot:CAMPEP_0181460410 /NCGR_PEP_ID=MMETSP1110-20121109/33326_1 /TAXON_ID=174948 /ORGANISM="Symbiodinium sp., Strain CCMP421" /LENGTH=112 /DNA_ID=CAMNT_0023584959 /DNA_START=1960 /DNA_END=2300 /DNA_ORIENTATION=-